MKKGWQTKKLSEVCSFLNRGISPRYLDDGGICVLNQKCIRDHCVSYEPSRRHDARAKKVGSERLIQAGDVLVNSTGTGTLGRVAQLREAPPEPTTVDSHVTIVRPMPGEFYPEFFGYMLVVIEDAIKEAGEGCGGQTELARSVLAEKFPVHYPESLPEQQRIVSILDEAFDGIATAKDNAEKNLQNARALFESHLQSVFTQRGGASTEGQTNPKSPTRSMPQEACQSPAADAEMARLNAGYVTKTGGREATLRHIPGNLSLAVGMPSTGARKGWRWSALTDMARLESGHTPSRKHPEYWGGSVPWIGIQDARENHGQRITDTFQKTNELGIANSSARVLPENTVCLSRTASVGYVLVMGRPMATSQDFVNWVCSDKLKPEFLKYLILAEGRDGLLRYASGSVHQTIYFPEAKAFHICYPEPKEQLRIVNQCDSIYVETQRLESLCQQKLAALGALKKSLLHQAFSGEL
jgi:restriction endonuclease S subunit